MDLPPAELEGDIIVGNDTREFLGDVEHLNDLGFLQKREARAKVEALSERYGLRVDLDAKVEDITVGMQQRVEILKMLYRGGAGG